MFQATGYRAQSIQLRPADRLVLVTDGVLEAGAPGSEFESSAWPGCCWPPAGLTPHQCVAEVLRTLWSYAPRMHDDATVICLDWNGPTTTVPAWRENPDSDAQ